MSLLFGNDKAEDEVEVDENQDQETSEDGEVETETDETETETDEDGEVKESYQARLRKRQIAAATIIKDVIAKAGIKLNAEKGRRAGYCHHLPPARPRADRRSEQVPELL